MQSRKVGAAVCTVHVQYKYYCIVQYIQLHTYIEETPQFRAPNNFDKRERRRISKKKKVGTVNVYVPTINHTTIKPEKEKKEEKKKSENRCRAG